VQVGGVPGASGAPGPQLLLSAPQAPLLGCSFARNDPRAVATCCDDGTVAVWDTAVSGMDRRLALDLAVLPLRMDILATCCQYQLLDGTVAVWDMAAVGGRAPAVWRLLSLWFWSKVRLCGLGL
jgi:hypothetical protein